MLAVAWILHRKSQGLSNAAKLHMKLYITFVILLRLHQDYTRFAQGLHIFVIQKSAVIF